MNLDGFLDGRLAILLISSILPQKYFCLVSSKEISILLTCIKSMNGGFLPRCLKESSSKYFSFSLLPKSRRDSVEDFFERDSAISCFLILIDWLLEFYFSER